MLAADPSASSNRCTSRTRPRTNPEEVRASAASEIRTLRDQILALANTEVRGRYIFAGSQVLSVPFTIAGDAVTYQGDLAVNSIEVSRGFRISQNVPGVSVFASVFNTIESLASALDIDDQAGIQAALGGFSAALGGLSRARAQVGSDLGVLQNLESELGGEKTNLRARQSRIQDANLAEAVTELTRIQTALKATLSAEAIVGKNNLFDFLA